MLRGVKKGVVKNCEKPESNEDRELKTEIWRFRKLQRARDS